MRKALYGCVALITVLSAPVVAAVPASARERIIALVGDSDCFKRTWADRGAAPMGYIKGMALTYAKSYCELVSTDLPLVQEMASPVDYSRVDKKGRLRDALAIYDSHLKPSRRLKLDTPVERLRSQYALAIGLGMRESSGNTTEGPDRTAPNNGPNEAEAGLFQVSFNSWAVSKNFQGSYEWYNGERSERCNLSTFMEGVKDKNVPVRGEGPPALFQSFTKGCPGFAVEYVIVQLRKNANHFGPINTKKTEYRQSCQDLLASVEPLVDQFCGQKISAIASDEVVSPVAACE